MESSEENSSPRHLLHHLAFEFLAVGMLGALHSVATPCAPLLEEEGDTMALGKLAQIEHPRLEHGTGIGTALAPDDHPLYASEIEVAKVFEQRFAREESHRGILYAPEGVYARQHLATFHGHSKPCVDWHLARGEVFRHALGSLGEQLVAMLRSGLYRAHHHVDKLKWHVGMKQVAH